MSWFARTVVVADSCIAAENRMSEREDESTLKKTQTTLMNTVRMLRKKAQILFFSILHFFFKFKFHDNETYIETCTFI